MISIPRLRIFGTRTSDLLYKRSISAQVRTKTMSKTISQPLVWIDCEMTGLDVFNDNIIEICCIITDGKLQPLDVEPYESTVYVSKEKLDKMDQWCQSHHGQSGLIDKVLANKDRTLAVVEQELYDYISSHIPQKTGLLAGNSVHMDKFFMIREFPKVIDYLHYRIVDVSSLREIGVRHNPEVAHKLPPKIGAHTAKSDILESIAQLKWYNENLLVQPKSGN